LKLKVFLIAKERENQEPGSHKTTKSQFICNSQAASRSTFDISSNRTPIQNPSPAIIADSSRKFVSQFPYPIDGANSKDSNSSPKEVIGLQRGTQSHVALPGFKLNLQEVKNDVGFHEEFMSHLEEFSLSWRMAASLEKKF
jgi:hypothetical protein